MKAFLITWEGTGEHAWESVRRSGIREHHVAAVLNPRLRGKTLELIAECLYAAVAYDPSDMAAVVRTRHQPYPAMWSKKVYIPHLHCGHNPFLWGRPVENLRQGELASAITWDELEPDPAVVARLRRMGAIQ